MFKPGQKVVCVSDAFTNPQTHVHFQQLPKYGEEYTVREYKPSVLGFYPARLLVVELVNKPIYQPMFGGKVEPGFDASRFISVEEFNTLKGELDAMMNAF